MPFFYAGNIGNIPLVLIAALCRDPSNPFGDSDKCNQDGNAYISFGQWVCLIFSFRELYIFMFWSKVRITTKQVKVNRCLPFRLCL